MAASGQGNRGLWTLLTGPVVWAVHFLVCYIGTAIFCARAGDPEADLAPVRLGIGAITLVALAVIAFVGIEADRRSGPGLVFECPHDEDTVRERRQFLGYATLLLAGVSFIATLLVALPALVIPSCR
jgi:hypothetical protein